MHGPQNIKIVRMYMCMYGWLAGWMNAPMNACTNACVCVCVCVYGCMYVYQQCAAVVNVIVGLQSEFCA
jgi:hypothetical protein